MTPAESKRIQALAEGRPVGEACSYCGGTAMRLGSPCDECWGSGTVRTAPEGPAEIAVATLRRFYAGRVADVNASNIAMECLVDERDAALARAESAEAEVLNRSHTEAIQTRVRELGGALRASQIVTRGHKPGCNAVAASVVCGRCDCDYQQARDVWKAALRGEPR